MKQVMFVCLGNICRSPAAEAVFQRIVSDHGAEARYHIDSSGTAAYHVGEKADARMRQAAAARGIQITHRGKQLSRADLQSFDRIFCMDRQNLADARRLAKTPAEREKIELYRALDPQGGTEVPDPYYGGADGFEIVLDIVTRCGEALFAELEGEK